MQKKKSEAMVRNYGWPELYGDFNDSTLIDNYHSHYNNIKNLDDWFDILMEIKKAYQITEIFSLYDIVPDRSNFLMSPALVNAWYQPERNSITLPYASLNPPYYNLRFPQAYNYAGQGGTAGHELTHGYDDGGVQFGPDGRVGDCTWNKCGWMDSNSSSGFLDMAQCVITQFSQNCCPLKSGNVHCASGERTQGENIADLGGELAAYRAYRRYIKEQRNGVEEDLLPGLEQYTPNQIFWLTYGYSWCMKYKEETLIRQLMTNPHSPGECRVNEVLRDIPEFAADFNCQRGSYMYPNDDQRCHVWVQ